MTTPRLTPCRRTTIEPLEIRIAPATHIWIGPGSGGLWSNAANWNGGVPTTGEAGGTVLQFNGNISSTDDVAGLVLDQVHFTAGGNNLLGAAGVTLGLSGAILLDNVINDAGSNTFGASLPITLSGSNAFFLVSSGKVTVASNVGGTQGLVLFNGSAAGTMALTGATNTYTGSTSVQAGTLELNAAGGHPAVPGKLTIGVDLGSASSAVVRFLNDAQLADTATVAMGFDGLLDGNGHTGTMAALTLQSGTTAGSTVNSNGGVFTVTGDIGSTASGTGATAATINGQLNLGSTIHGLDVSDGAGASDLILAAKMLGTGGYTKTGAGTVEVKSSGPTGPVHVAEGTLLLNSSGFSDAIQGSLEIGQPGGSVAATVRLAQSLEIGDSVVVTVHNTGALDFNGFGDTLRGLVLESGLTSGANVTTDGATVNLTEGLIGITSDGGGTPATLAGKISLTAGTHVFDIARGTAGSDVRITASIGGGGALTKSGAGILELANTPGDNTYTGDTVIAAGTLLLTSPSSSDSTSDHIVIGDGTGAPASAVLRFGQSNVVSNTATITVLGDGLLNMGSFQDSVGDVTVQAHGGVDLGSGTLNCGNVALGAGSTFAADSNGRLNATGTAAVDGTLILRLATPVVPGATVTLLSNDASDAVTGTFAGLPEGALVGTPGGLYTMSYAGGSGNDVVLTGVDAASVVTIDASGKSATYADVDGDLVTVKVTKGTLTKDNFQFGGIPGGLLGGYQLQTLTLSDASYTGAKVTFTAKPTAAGGNGRVNVGYLDATGVDLAAVTVPGDVSRLDAGDADPKLPGAGVLTVGSFGALGDTTQRQPGAVYCIAVGVGSLVVKGDVVGANLSLGKAGTISIAGSLAGSAATGAGDLDLTSARKITIGGSILAPDGTASGRISATGDLGGVTVGHDLIGSARIVSDGKLGPVAILGEVRGASAAHPAIISGAGAAGAPKGGADVAIASVRIGHSVEDLQITAGSTRDGVPVTADAAIGAITIGGDFRASSILAGAAAGADGLPGTPDDTKLTNARDASNRFSSIASIVIKGQALGTVGAGDVFGIVAEQIGTARIGGVSLKLKPGARSATDAFALGYASAGPGGAPSDLYLREITA